MQTHHLFLSTVEQAQDLLLLSVGEVSLSTGKSIGTQAWANTYTIGARLLAGHPLAMNIPLVCRPSQSAQAVARARWTRGAFASA